MNIDFANLKSRSPETEGLFILENRSYSKLTSLVVIFYVWISVIGVLILLMLFQAAVAITQRQMIMKLRREMVYTDALPRNMELREQPPNINYSCINTHVEINDQDSDGYTEPGRRQGEYNNPESDYSSILGQRPTDYEYTDVISGSQSTEEERPTEYDYTEVICNAYSSVRRSEYLEPAQCIQNVDSKETITTHL